MEVLIEKAAEDELKAKPDQSNLGFGAYFSDHMLVMPYDSVNGWHSPQIRKYQNFSLDPAAMVYHYGQAIFEGLKAYRGPEGQLFLFRPSDNLKRMNDSATRMCMPPIPVNDVLP